MTPTVTAVHVSQTHTFSKFAQDEITPLTGLGIEGDAHGGVTLVKNYPLFVPHCPFCKGVLSDQFECNARFWPYEQ